MITIYGTLRSLKNSKQIVKRGNKTWLTSSDLYKKDLADLTLQVRNAKFKFAEMLKDKKPPYQLCFKIYRKDNRHFDYINNIQGLCDVMVKEGILKDDDMNNLLPSFLPFSVDKEYPRVVITYNDFKFYE